MQGVSTVSTMSLRFHNRWNRSVQVPHPNLWTFIRKMKDECKRIHLTLSAAKNGQCPPTKRLLYRRTQKRIRQLKPSNDGCCVDSNSTMERTVRLLRSSAQTPEHNSLSRTYLYCRFALRRYYSLLIIAVIVLYVSTTLGNYALSVNNDQLRMDTTESQQQQQCPDADTTSDFLCLCTTFKPGDYKIPIYRNTLFNWMSLSSCGRVRAVLYDTTSSPLDVVEDQPQQRRNKMSRDDWWSVRLINRMATLLGWQVLTLPRVSPYGVPYLKDMFRDLAERYPSCKFIAYANGDIMFNGGLLRTLEVVEQELHRLGDILAVGRRTNVYMDELKSNLDFSPSGVTRIALTKGELYHDGAHDFFILHRNKFPWNSFPDFVIGRPLYDLYLVAKALELNVSVIEVSRTVIALHQIDGDGLRSGSNIAEDRGKNFNKAYIGNFEPSHGMLRNVRYFTNFAAYENSTTLDEYQTRKMMHELYYTGKRSSRASRVRPVAPRMSDVHLYRWCRQQHDRCSQSPTEKHRRIDGTT